MPLFDLGLRGKTVVVPKTELLSLVLYKASFSEACCLSEFWGTVVAEFYDPSEAIDMISVLLFGPWGCFDVPEAVVSFVDENDSSKTCPEFSYGVCLCSHLQDQTDHMNQIRMQITFQASHMNLQRLIQNLMLEN